MSPPRSAQVGAEAPGPYSLPEGLVVDVPHFAGQPWELVRDDASVQLGDIQAVLELDPRDGRRYVFERGAFQVVNGEVYLVEVQLPRPMRRSAALNVCGLPVQVDDWFTFSGEYRARWHAGYDRIRMERLQDSSGAPSPGELVVSVEALKYDPRGQL